MDLKELHTKTNQSRHPWEIARYKVTKALLKKIIKILENKGFNKFVINVGGDLYASYDQKIYIQNPFNPSKFLEKIMVQKGAVATSSPILRSWQQGDKNYHHLVDPTTNSTSLKWASCTFICDDIIDADIWAKIVILSNANVSIPLDNIKVYLIDYDLNLVELV